MNSADNETSLHWSEEKEVVSTNNALKFLLLLLKITPRWFVHFLVLPVGFFYFLCSRRGRTECRLYQNQLKEFTNGAVPKRVSAYNQIESFSLCIVERMEGWLGKYRFKDLITHDDDLAELIERLNNRQGAILIGSHLGCIEFLRSLSYQDSTGVNRSVPVLAIMKTGATEQFNKTLNEINPGSSLNLIDPSEITPDTMIQMQELIENGGLVVFTADRTSEGSRSRCIRKNFLGKPADFPYGVFLLVALLKAPAYYMFALRSKNFAVNSRYNMFIERSGVDFNCPRSAREERIEALCQEFVEKLQKFCLQFPYQWYNFYNFWLLNEGDCKK